MSLNLCQYWMCEARSLQTFIDRLSRVEVERLRNIEAEGKAGQPTAAAPIQFQIDGQTALIHISGVLLQRIPQWLEEYVRKGIVDASDLEVIRLQVQQAAADPEVKEIRLLVHSPGGTVAGTMEAAAAIAKARKVKPVIADIESLAASGGYYLSSQASRIESNADGEIGSIGVYAVYYDYSKAAEAEGVKTVVISSGSIKGMAVPGSVITEEQIASVRDVIMDMHGHFVQAVASGRRISIEQARKLADGRLWLAPKAKQLKLIDEITTNFLGYKPMETKTKNKTADSIAPLPPRNRLQESRERENFSQPEKSNRPAAERFKAAVDAGIQSGLSKAKAMRRAIHSDPEGHRSYLADRNPEPPVGSAQAFHDAYAKNRKDGMSRAAAIRAASKLEADHRAWLLNGCRPILRP